MLTQLFIIIACQLLGMWLVETSGLPIPGTVVGMLLLFMLLVVRGGAPQKMVDVVTPLHGHMSLLFIPAGSGVLLYVDRVANEWVPITVALVVSTFIALWVTAWVFRRFLPTESNSASADITDTGERES